MNSKTVEVAISTEESLSALSTQLVSLGYLSRPLDLSTLFLSPALPTNPSSKALKRHHDLLVLQARAREQIAKCLWGMLEQRQSEREVMEGLLAGEARAAEDAERERKGRDRAEREKEVMARELEAERAKSKELEVKLKSEQERHRHVREELSKTKNALQFVKTQAGHDQRRRESEVQSLHQRLQKLTTAPSSAASDSAFTRFVTLNASASSPSASPLTATFGAARPTRTSRLGGPSSGAQPSDTSPTSAVLEAELDLLRTALAECVSARSSLEGEVGDLRVFVGEVSEWAEGMLDVPELVAVRKDGEEGQEMRGVLAGEGDESYLVPTPHLALPIPAITAPLHRKLYAIRLGLLSLSSTSSSALGALREELEHEIERLHEEVEEEQHRRAQVEGERDEARKLVKAGEKVVKEWAEKAERDAQKVKQDESDDDLPPEIVASLAVDKQKRLAHKVARHAPAAGHAEPAPVPSVASASSSRPSIPSAHVSAFLSELGLDTPGLPSSASNGVQEKAPLKADRAPSVNSGDRESVQSQHEVRKERVRPSIARPTAARERETGRGGAAKEPEREQEGAMLPPANPVRRSAPSVKPSETRNAVRPSSHTADREEPSSTLEDILALAASPPVTSEPLVSARVQAQTASVKERPVLASSRAANAPPPADTTSSAGGAQTEGDRVRAKKAALLAKARSARGRETVAPA